MDPQDLYDDEFDPDLSQLLDEALHQEEYHREELIRWRDVRKRLENLIPDDPVEEAIQVAKEAWGND